MSKKETREYRLKMIASQSKSRNDEQVLPTPSASNRKLPRDLSLDATPIVSNRSVPMDLNLDDKFSLDSPASALTEQSGRSSANNRRQRRTPRFSSLDDEPIVVPRSRFNQQSLPLYENKNGGLSWSKNHISEEQQRNKRRDNHRSMAPFSLLSSITFLMTKLSRNNASEWDKVRFWC